MNPLTRIWKTARLVPPRDFLRPSRMRLIRTVSPYTLLPFARLSHLADLADDLPPGNVVECGAFDGGSGAVLAAASGRTTWLFDSWEGCPPPGPWDIDRDGLSAETGQFAGSLARAQHLAYDVLSLPADRMRFVQGWFADTLPKTRAKIGEIALLHIDADWYESVKECLELLYDQVVPGGIVVVDDYGYWLGCRRAVDEWRAGRAISLVRFDDTEVWFRKPDEVARLNGSVRGRKT